MLHLMVLVLLRLLALLVLNRLTLNLALLALLVCWYVISATFHVALIVAALVTNENALFLVVWRRAVGVASAGLRVL